ncbi:MAG: hypothetical protein P8Z35_02650 [Ignavibacteriaceae bacterium]
MNYNPKYHHRHSIRLKGYDYSWPGWYYITICTKDRKCLFGHVIDGKMILNKYGRITEKEWLKTKEIRKNVDLDYYIIMPNHIHGIIIIEKEMFNQNNAEANYNLTKDNKSILQTKTIYVNNDVGTTQRVAPTLQPNSLGAIIGQFKSVVTKRINKINNTPGNSIWQRNYYEHILRNETDLFYTRNYIKNNPLKWEIDELFRMDE